MKLRMENGGVTKLKLMHDSDGNVILACGGYFLFTFQSDGHVFAHSCIDADETGLRVTRKFNRVKLDK